MDMPLSVGDVVMFRDRFKQDKYAILQVVKITDDIHIDAECLSTHGGYYLTPGRTIYWHKQAHCDNQSTTIDLTYYLTAGSLLYGHRFT